MEESERLAIAAHLHVVMRRKMGRVTDTEWMAGNQAYAMAMVALALAHANEKADEEMSRLAHRLEQSWTGENPGSKTLSTEAVTSTSESFVTSRAAEMLRTSARYIGGLR